MRKLGDAVELTVDDVVLKRATPYPAVWEQKTFVTFAEVTQEEVKDGLSKKRLQDLGHFVWGLLAPLMNEPAEKHSSTS